MKPATEGLTLSLMSTLICALTFFGALGVEPNPQPQAQSVAQMKAN
jgi:hypothetical protein